MNLENEVLNADGQLDEDRNSSAGIAVSNSESEAVQSSDVHGLIQQVSAGIAWQKRFLRILMIFPSVLAPVLVALLFVLRSRLGPDVFVNWIKEPSVYIPILGVMLSAPPMLAIALRKQQAGLDSVAERLGEMDDIPLITPLVDLLAMDHRVVRKNSMKALIRLLPRMTPENSELLGERQRARLIRILRMNPQFFLYKDVTGLLKPAKLDRDANVRAIELRIAILKAFESVGGPRELQAVRQLAANPLSTPASDALREAAKQVLPALEVRVAALRKGDLLLRPSAGDRDGSSNLLHSLESGAMGSPGSLMRPVE